MSGTAPEAEPVGAGLLARFSLTGALVGLIAGAGAAAFTAAQHHLTHLLWHTLPEAMGFEAAPWWLILALPVIGAGLTWLAIQLPGHGGHGPLDGLKLDLGPRQLVSVLLAALASLSFGAVLGPEAPLLAIGTAAGFALLRSPDHPTKSILPVVGAMAAAGAVLGNPLVTLILLLELAVAVGTQVARPTVLLPALAGLGTGYLLQVGLGPWTGLGQAQLSLPNLPAYPVVRPLDLLVGAAIAIVVAMLAVTATRGGHRIMEIGRKHQLPVLLGAGVAVGLSGIIVELVSGQSAFDVLFAGQSSMTAYLAVPSIGAGLALLLGKLAAYTICLGGGFKGGSMFPAIALGTILAGMAALFLGSAAVPGLAAVAIAAAVAAAQRLPFTGVLLASMMTIAAGPAVTVPAILGALIGLFVRLELDHRLPAALSPAASA